MVIHDPISIHTHIYSHTRAHTYIQKRLTKRIAATHERIANPTAIPLTLSFKMFWKTRETRSFGILHPFFSCRPFRPFTFLELETFYFTEMLAEMRVHSETSILINRKLRTKSRKTCFVHDFHISWNTFTKNSLKQKSSWKRMVFPFLCSQ